MSGCANGVLRNHVPGDELLRAAAHVRSSEISHHPYICRVALLSTLYSTRRFPPQNRFHVVAVSEGMRAAEECWYWGGGVGSFRYVSYHHPLFQEEFLCFVIGGGSVWGKGPEEVWQYFQGGSRAEHLETYFRWIARNLGISRVNSNVGFLFPSKTFKYPHLGKY